ncbi:hypothetical protein KC19_10G189600 [Ceratodon purpureus]|uniref:Uncharacterized protein n=1 Tax=Ceratodon purpureus TaxID=3225 RepID=A0A8T0GPP2_CERPU|nr:hypothetical protein KC19_10G189600 [Ceratodon purpureus]
MAAVVPSGTNDSKNNPCEPRRSASPRWKEKDGDSLTETRRGCQGKNGETPSGIGGAGQRARPGQGRQEGGDGGGGAAAEGFGGEEVRVDPFVAHRTALPCTAHPLPTWGGSRPEGVIE